LSIERIVSFSCGQPLTKGGQQRRHDEWSTVREAFRFSAILRQPRDVSKEDKYRYVETVIDLLELRDYAEARIGKLISPIKRPGAYSPL
jgi:hypothetical protein